jgi:zinc-ribbon domain
MYCPQCATANPDDVKFCRSCGTQLEAVALALSGKPATPDKGSKKKNELTEEDWLEKRIAGVGGITRGSMLLAVSLLLAIPLGLFLPATFDAPWILIWVVFFGWMAIWGGIDIANGISSALESRSRLRLMAQNRRESVPDATTQGLLAGGEPVLPANTTGASRSSSPISVTEGTTRHLDD